MFLMLSNSQCAQKKFHCIVVETGIRKGRLRTFLLWTTVLTAAPPCHPPYRSTFLSRELAFVFKSVLILYLYTSWSSTVYCKQMILLIHKSRSTLLCLQGWKPYTHWHTYTDINAAGWDGRQAVRHSGHVDSAQEINRLTDWHLTHTQSCSNWQHDTIFSAKFPSPVIFFPEAVLTRAFVFTEILLF